MNEFTDVAISASGLIKRYGSIVALDGLDLQVAVGSVYGLLGANGAGKTTAVRALTTTLIPDAGSAAVMGRDVRRNPRGVRALIGLAGQFAAVDPLLSGRENLRLVGRLAQLRRGEATTRSDALLERFGLGAAADRLVRTYSGGMRRRLDVAAALVHEPQVVFLDEPTTGLDPESRAELWEMIRELAADGRTVLLTTQYLEEADRLCARLAIIDQGRVIAEGTPSDMKASLGDSVIELQLADEATAARAQATLERAGSGTQGKAEKLGGVRREGARVLVSATEVTHSLVGALRALDADGIAPVALDVREPSLDDAFLALTGKSGRDPATQRAQPHQTTSERSAA